DANPAPARVRTSAPWRGIFGRGPDGGVRQGATRSAGAPSEYLGETGGDNGGPRDSTSARYAGDSYARGDGAGDYGARVWELQGAVGEGVPGGSGDDGEWEGENAPRCPALCRAH
ncbi:hypothetical protein V491_08411, partial [Pseudogymnoascus sp. VKM F-3775]